METATGQYRGVEARLSKKEKNMMKRMGDKKKKARRGITKKTLGYREGFEFTTIPSASSVIFYLPSIMHFSSPISRKTLVKRFILAFTSGRESALLNPSSSRERARELRVL